MKLCFRQSAAFLDGIINGVNKKDMERANAKELKTAMQTTGVTSTSTANDTTRPSVQSTIAATGTVSTTGERRGTAAEREKKSMQLPQDSRLYDSARATRINEGGEDAVLAKVAIDNASQWFHTGTLLKSTCYIHIYVYVCQHSFSQ